MTIGEKLLQLTVEYIAAIESNKSGHPVGDTRDPAVIAQDYEAALVDLMAESLRSGVSAHC